MEKVIIIFIFALLSMPVVAQVKSPTDLATIEALIAKHKMQLKRLQERDKGEKANLGLTATVKKATEDLEKLNQELHKQYFAVSAWANVGISTAYLLKDIKRLSNALTQYIGTVNKIKNPYILHEYITSSKNLKTEIEYTIQLFKKVPFLRADAANINTFILEIQSHVKQLRYIINRANYTISARMALAKMKFEDTPIDKAKIANKIIKEFSHE